MIRSARSVAVLMFSAVARVASLSPIGEQDVGFTAHDRERRAELVGDLGREAPLRDERLFQTVEHVVEGVGEILELVVGSVQIDARGEIVRRRGAGPLRDQPDRSQRAAGDEPPDRAGDEREHADRDRGPDPRADHRVVLQPLLHLLERVVDRGSRSADPDVSGSNSTSGCALTYASATSRSTCSSSKIASWNATGLL